MGVSALAKTFIRFSTPEELREAVKYSAERTEPVLILGGGSNILFAADFEGIVLQNSIEGFRVVSETSEEVVIKIGAGENWHDVVKKCVDNNWGGIENLALIPGTVGAAPIQNIGAYGVELKDVFVGLEALHLDKLENHNYNLAECKFGYRDSIFKQVLKGKVVITSVTLRLEKNALPNYKYAALKSWLEEKGIEKPTINDVFEAVIEVRQSKLPDPTQIGNNGSFFKNPVIPVFHFEELKQQYPDIPSYPVTQHLVKVPAGWLIETAGWKGYRSGDAGVHDKQALVLVNHGSATGREIFQLSESIKEDIEKKFGISLVREVNLIL